MTSVFSAGRVLHLVAAAAASIILLGSASAAPVADAAAAPAADKAAAPAVGKGNPFPLLDGNWKCVRGGCWVRPVGGVKERVGCRVNYKIEADVSLSQSINCKGSIQLTASSKVTRSQDGSVSGDWTSFNNHTGRLTGSATGVAEIDRITVGITSKDGKLGAMRTTIGEKSHTVKIYETVNGKQHQIGNLSLSR